MTTMSVCYVYTNSKKLAKCINSSIANANIMWIMNNENSHIHSLITKNKVDYI